MADLTSDPAITVCFVVTIDGHDLGAFTSCDGLGCDVAIEKFEEGGNPFFVHQLPGRLSYTNIKLTRPINRDSEKVAAWFATMGVVVKRSTAHIVAMTLEGDRVAAWNLTGVIPVRWSGPRFDVDSPKVATESVELAHHGFALDPAGSRR